MQNKKSFDGIIIKKITPSVLIKKPFFKPAVYNSRVLEKSFFHKFFIPKKVPILVAVVGLILAFAAGSWAVLTTSKSNAETEQGLVFSQNEDSVLGNAEPEIIPISNNPVNAEPVNNVSDQAILNLTIDQLEAYLAQALKTPETKQAEVLALRKQKLRAYLEEKKSPFITIVDTIAELKHWKLVLAISNSESSLGKRCDSKNCSGIGVEPGHVLWRSYSSTALWAKDFDKLLEKRYKDWTLEEMNGVYNKPGSSNWVYAATQVLEDLKDRGIE